MRFAFVCVAACVIGLAISSQARAYNLFGPYPWGTEGKIYYEKWGDIFSVGVPGGTITWSFIPDGTPIDPSFTDANFSGTSSLTNIMNSLGYNDALAAIQRAFDKWSAVSNISFQQVSDSGVAFNSPSAVTPNTGQIRIGAYAINGSVGAVGWSGWPFGDTLSGDILLNSSNLFQIHQGNEGDPVRINGTYYNDLEGLVVHEIGHTMGIAHTNICSVMSGNPACYELLNRELDPDDIAAAQFLYGPSPSADCRRPAAGRPRPPARSARQGWRACAARPGRRAR